MYSRVTLLEIDTMRMGIDEAVELFRREVLPALREQEGYEGVFVFANPEGPGMIVSLWETKEAMDAAAGFATGALERFATIFRSPPGREHYRLRLVDTVNALLKD
jgi:hypothetical protein